MGLLRAKKFKNHVSDKNDTLDKCAIFFVDHFLDFGTSESVKIALLRLNGKQKIKRLPHRIYEKPKLSNIIAELVLSIEDYAMKFR